MRPTIRSSGVAGLVALAAGLLLVLVVAVPASSQGASEVCPNENQGWTKVDNPTLGATYDLVHDGQVIGTVLVGQGATKGIVTITSLDEGHTVDLCVKGGSNTPTSRIYEFDEVAGDSVGPVTNRNGPADVSHFSYVVDVAVPATTPLTPTPTPTPAPGPAPGPGAVAGAEVQPQGQAQGQAQTRLAAVAGAVQVRPQFTG